jgi:hypothetical protein
VWVVQTLMPETLEAFRRLLYAAVKPEAVRCPKVPLLIMDYF